MSLPRLKTCNALPQHYRIKISARKHGRQGLLGLVPVGCPYTFSLFYTHSLSELVILNEPLEILRMFPTIRQSIGSKNNATCDLQWIPRVLNGHHRKKACLIVMMEEMGLCGKRKEPLNNLRVKQFDHESRRCLHHGIAIG